MPLLFSNPPFVAFGGNSTVVANAARVAPVAVRPDEVANLPAGCEYWIWLDGQATYDQAAPLLDAGAQRIISRSPSLLSQVPPNRLVLELADGIAPDAQTLRQISGVYLSASYSDLAALKKVREQLGGPKSADQFDIYVSPASTPDVASVAALVKAKLGVVPVLPTELLSISGDGESAGSGLDLAQLFAATLVTDRADGLFTTIVHSTDGQSLGLVYSSLASLAHSIASPQAQATYFSRSRNALWIKGATSGAYQRIAVIRRDCDGDAVEFVVEPVVKVGLGSHFCHTGRSASCFGPATGLARLESTLLERKQSAPQGSYSARLFSDRTLLDAKIREEADEVCRATSKEELASEAADLLYFLLARCASESVSLADVGAVLDRRADKVTRRPGNAKPQFLPNGHHQVEPPAVAKVNGAAPALDKVESPVASTSKALSSDAPIVPPLYELNALNPEQRAALLKRPLVASDEMVGRVRPIIDAVRAQGDAALRSYVAKLDRCTPASSDSAWPIVLNAPFDASLMQLDDATKAAIDQAFANIGAFHQAQMDRESKILEVETMPGIVCKRMCRPIDRVGLYIPGGTAVLPSTALMLAIPASIAKCSFISIATPPLPDGSIRPEIVYIAHRTGVQQIVRAGGAHAVAAFAYGTGSVGKVDKVFGPGNQWVTAAKMAVSMDASAGVGIDMPAGPSEVLVIADSTADPAFVASDLLSQAEHGPDSQVVLLAVDLDAKLLGEIQQEIDRQARALPRVEVVRTCLTKSLLIKCPTLAEALDFSNAYAPEHLILHLRDSEGALPTIRNAGSVFVGAWSPESCGDYASGTNHTLPTYGYARQYSGVSTSSFLKHITTQALTPEGLDALGPTVVRLAEVEGLEAHANAVRVRLQRRALTKGA